MTEMHLPCNGERTESALENLIVFPAIFGHPITGMHLKDYSLPLRGYLTEPKAGLDLLILEPFSDLEHLFQELKLSTFGGVLNRHRRLAGLQVLLRNDCHTFSKAVPIKLLEGS